MKRESYAGLGEGNLHFSAGEQGVMQCSNSPKTVLDVVVPHQGHILVRRLFENVHIRHLTLLLEDFHEGLLVAGVLLEGGDVQGG